MIRPGDKEFRFFALIGLGIASVFGTVTLLVTTWWPFAWAFASMCVGVASWPFRDDLRK
ncbi:MULTISPECIES: hypothetical protein [unclassified Pseudomonas]|uniref:hypothetical protein n=1 Tax=unclassified Pseudomonas TaxID=196821 RepID=UPI002B2361BC|nr:MULTISPECIES: hypothetical protein [unclassified Pseudomonas]MEB0005178.1 hypothetical protein [Pseudomonas sp. RTB2]MEB0019992.1 hypothetical protein [Pseudomonas sp. RTB3]MEB0271161.1 hypothetical protein [Pseudomonas sp. 5B4]